jgi:hypothetical protein
VHAQPAAESIAVRFHGGQLVGRDYFLGGDLVVVGKTPTFGTTGFACLATDAEGAVIKDSSRHKWTLYSLLADFMPNM